MFFLQKTTHLQLLDVLYWQEEKLENRTKARAFDALSIRMESDARFDTGNETVSVRSRDVTFVPAGCGYTRHCTVDKMIVFHFLMDPPPTDTKIQVIQNHDYDILYPLFRKALTEWTEKKPGYYYRAVSLVYRIFGELCRQSEPAEQSIKPLVLRAISLMKVELKRPRCTVSWIAGRLNVSEAYLRRLFQQELGTSPKQYLTELRLQYARELLNAGYDPISVISEKVGFTDPKNFATAYKKHFGYPPSAQSYSLNE